jgi:hypothetical protein
MNFLKNSAADRQSVVMNDIKSNLELITSYKTYWITDAIYIQGDAEYIRHLAALPEIEFVFENLPLVLVEPVASTETSDEESGAEPGLEAIGARDAWQMGLTGQGRLVCSFDTGVMGTHPALAAKWRGANGASAAASWFDPYTNTTSPSDSRGHGTHTMGTMVGCDGSDTVGVAFNAEWIAAGVVDRGGSIDRTVADILSAFEWAADPDGNPATTDDVPDVVNNSWGVPSGYYGACDMTFWDAIDNLEALGVVCIFAAGNEGPYESTLRTPADRISTQFNAFSVGAVDGSTLEIGRFSSRGPSGCDGRTIKPELTAPGVSVRSCSNTGGYAVKSGTSMAAPHVSGAVAILRQFNPAATVDEIKAAMIAGSVDLGDPGEDNSYGYGLLNIKNALYHMPAPAHPFVHVLNTNVDDGFNGMAEPGETFALQIRLENLGSNGQVNAILSSSATGVQILDAEGLVGEMARFDTTTISLFRVRIPYQYTTGDQIDFSITFESTSWSQTYSFSLPIGESDDLSISTITTNTLAMSFSNVGQFGLGENSINPAGGVGFRYPVNGTDFMKEASLMISASGHVSDGARNGAGEPDDDFQPLSGGQAMVTAPGVYADYDGYAAYSDSAAENPIGVNITQRCFAWDMDTKFIILEFTIENITAEAINDLRVGMFCDWDLALSSGIDDIIGYDDIRSLGYIEDAPSGWCIGVRAITDYPGSYKAINNDDELADGFSDAEKLQFMNSGFTDIHDSTPGDYSQLLTVGPYTLAPAESEVVAFAFVVGESLTEIRAQADLAFGMYPQLTGVIDDQADLPGSIMLNQNYPNPFNNNTVISFNAPEPTSLSIFDINGRLVKEFQVESAGYHELTWQGENMAGQKVVSGVYFYSIGNGAKLVSKKMIMLK